MSASAVTPWRKRSIESSGDPPIIENKRSRNSSSSSPFWYKLASESSNDLQSDDTESVYSVQDKSTDIVKDTSDSETSSTIIDFEIEYDVASLSGNESDFNTTDEDDIVDIALIAASVCDSSIENFITDAEDSDNSLQDDYTVELRDFWTCILCKSQNDNPQFRYCDKCFQDRKMRYPPRPRRHKKAAAKRTPLPHQASAKSSPVKLEALQSCLSGMSQDSGIGSSQELESLNLAQIQVPKHLAQDVATPSTSFVSSTSSSGILDNGSRKRNYSESSLSEDVEQPTRPQKKGKMVSSLASGVVETKRTKVTVEKEKIEEVPKTECNMCMMCNSRVKDGAFLHGRIAHMCSCYTCAKRTWKSSKRCPICNRTISNIVKVFST